MILYNRFYSILQTQFFFLETQLHLTFNPIITRYYFDARFRCCCCCFRRRRCYRCMMAMMVEKKSVNQVRLCVCVCVADNLSIIFIFSFSCFFSNDLHNGKTQKTAEKHSLFSLSFFFARKKNISKKIQNTGTVIIIIIFLIISILF